MNVLLVILGVLVAFGAVGAGLIQRFEKMPSKKKKKLFTKTINEVYTWFEDHGLMRRNPPYIRDYHREYPELKVLEDNHAINQTVERMGAQHYQTYRIYQKALR